MHCSVTNILNKCEVVYSDGNISVAMPGTIYLVFRERLTTKIRVFGISGSPKRNKQNISCIFLFFVQDLRSVLHEDDDGKKALSLYSKEKEFVSEDHRRKVAKAIIINELRNNPTKE